MHGGNPQNSDVILTVWTHRASDAKKRRPERFTKSFKGPGRNALYLQKGCYEQPLHSRRPRRDARISRGARRQSALLQRSNDPRRVLVLLPKRANPLRLLGLLLSERPDDP